MTNCKISPPGVPVRNIALIGNSSLGEYLSYNLYKNLVNRKHVPVLLAVNSGKINEVGVISQQV